MKTFGKKNAHATVEWQTELTAEQTQLDGGRRVRTSRRPFMLCCDVDPPVLPAVPANNTLKPDPSTAIRTRGSAWDET
jgi:hypothetical protein